MLTQVQFPAVTRDFFLPELSLQLLVQCSYSPHVLSHPTRTQHCSTCSAGQAITATLSKTHPSSGWSSAVWFQPSHWAHSTPSFGQRPARAEKSHMILMGYKPKTSRPTVRDANHSLRGQVHLILDNILDDMGTEWLYDPNACCGWPADGWQHDPYNLMRLNVKIHCKL